MTVEELHELYQSTTGISTDTRTIKKGSLFVALAGAQFDGNTFALEALEKGAAYTLVSDKNLASFSPQQEKMIYVPDTLLCLQELARFHRRQFTLPIIAITGSNGKTTTKELISTVLDEKYKIVKSEGNLNNHIGVPLTLLGINKSTEIAIVEMGANKISDIRELCKIAEPTHGLITNIGSAHLQGFKNKEGVVRAKSELYIWLRDHVGTVFINKKDNELKRLLQVIDIHQASPTIEYGDEKIPENEFLFGDYNKENMKAAYAVGVYFDVPIPCIKKALKDYEPKNMRNEKRITKRDNELILDAYNANPSSMEASLRAFAEIKTKRAKWLILGDMKELGEYSGKEHRRIADLVESLRLTNVLFIGEEFFEAIGSWKRHAVFKNKEECEASLLLGSIKKSLVFIKGSNGMKLWELVGKL